jgi:hypothetical protein
MFTIYSTVNKRQAGRRSPLFWGGERRKRKIKKFILCPQKYTGTLYQNALHGIKPVFAFFPPRLLCGRRPQKSPFKGGKPEAKNWRAYYPRVPLQKKSWRAYRPCPPIFLRSGQWVRLSLLHTGIAKGWRIITSKGAKRKLFNRSGGRRGGGGGGFHV